MSAAIRTPRAVAIGALREHPESSLVPLMPPAEFRALVDDIRERGILEPLQVLEGVVLDGRHRLRVAHELGLGTVPAVEVALGSESQVSFMVKAAVRRRHLTEDQKALLATELQRELSKEARAQQAKEVGRLGGRPRRETQSGEVPERVSSRQDSPVQAAQPVAASAAPAEELLFEDEEELRPAEPCSMPRYLQPCSSQAASEGPGVPPARDGSAEALPG